MMDICSHLCMGAVMERYEYEYNSVERVIFTFALYQAIFSLKIPRLWLDWFSSYLEHFSTVYATVTFSFFVVSKSTVP